jgi:hypothetical protein
MRLSEGEHCFANDYFDRNMHTIMLMVIECKEHCELSHKDKAIVTITNQR